MKGIPELITGKVDDHFWVKNKGHESLRLSNIITVFTCIHIFVKWWSNFTLFYVLMLTTAFFEVFSKTWIFFAIYCYRINQEIFENFKSIEFLPFEFNWSHRLIIMFKEHFLNLFIPWSNFLFFEIILKEYFLTDIRGVFLFFILFTILIKHGLRVFACNFTDKLECIISFQERSEKDLAIDSCNWDWVIEKYSIFPFLHSYDIFLWNLNKGSSKENIVCIEVWRKAEPIWSYVEFSLKDDFIG